MQAEIAGIMASKQTSHLIPLCHQINLDYSKITYQWFDARATLRILCSVQVTDKTGCEMEAIVGSQIAAATIYDMCKGTFKAIEIQNCHLVSKTGGKSGDYFHTEE